jgi:hypothetical protein
MDYQPVVLGSLDDHDKLLGAVRDTSAQPTELSPGVLPGLALGVYGSAVIEQPRAVNEHARRAR